MSGSGGQSGTRETAVGWNLVPNALPGHRRTQGGEDDFQIEAEPLQRQVVGVQPGLFLDGQIIASIDLGPARHARAQHLDAGGGAQRAPDRPG